MKNRILFAIVTVVLFGCASSVPGPSKEDSAKKYEYVQVLRGDVSVGYVPLGTVTAHDLMCNSNDLMRELKQKAGELGATAIFIDLKVVLTDCNHNLVAVAAKPKL